MRTTPTMRGRTTTAGTRDEEEDGWDGDGDDKDEGQQRGDDYDEDTICEQGDEVTGTSR